MVHAARGADLPKAYIQLVACCVYVVFIVYEGLKHYLSKKRKAIQMKLSGGVCVCVCVCVCGGGQPSSVTE